MAAQPPRPVGERSMGSSREAARAPARSPAWASTQASTPGAALAVQRESPESGLQKHYSNLCMEKSQKINPFILHILQEVDEEIKKGLAAGITLNIAGNNRLVPVERVTGEDFWILSKILKNCLYINGLDVGYNLLCDVGAYYAAKLLQKQLNLIYLNLMFNDIGPEGGELIAKVLHNRTLKYLRMTGNKIENKGGMFFAAMLQINSSLEKLDLGDCDLGMQSVIAFATVLTQNQAIKAINLNRPILYSEQEESTVHVGRMLKENHCLVALHMCKHDIKNSGIQQLCDALYLNSSLRYLDVSCNKITHDGMVYLADVLKSNTTLEVIDLSFNRIENAGANYLSETLTSHNRSLKALSVVSNNIEGEGLVALSQSMKTNLTFSHIYIWGNKFDEATCIAYSDLIQMGCLKPDNTDVEPFVVDGRVYLAEVSNGLKKHYYWTSTYGESYDHSSNAGFALVPVGQQP
ncbi:leucine-rich repeat-containing protein 34 isoform X1 [Homo sapiens]|uniref:leucine-rich repeat-containing protein 34 isoform X1 n=2 Tax=Homo sapiens TaxID=9606 RepID=UPI0005CFF682|nr:leucine-rich repeat-containing protein 34 isoform X1 [Homo sapiens]XP_054201314.1 leucine-rich repeat-containing protein 34 isoform X1 [Homo sapiens]|eukprot:XP_011510744.1 leucine-rich repeat-containing protein 34 isoform X1 [Homo sapiens]